MVSIRQTLFRMSQTHSPKAQLKTQKKQQQQQPINISLGNTVYAKYRSKNPPRYDNRIYCLLQTVLRSIFNFGKSFYLLTNRNKPNQMNEHNSFLSHFSFLSLSR